MADEVDGQSNPLGIGRGLFLTAAFGTLGGLAGVACTPGKAEGPIVGAAVGVFGAIAMWVENDVCVARSKREAEAPPRPVGME